MSPAATISLNNRSPEKWLIMALGFTSMSAQLILLRDFLRLFQGNELVIGLLLASWMFITALGAWSGHRFRIFQKNLFFLFFTVALLPPLTHFFLIWLSHVFFTPGVMTGLLHMFLFSWLVLLPFCFISGISFTAFSSYMSNRHEKNKTNQVYYLEAAGSMAGGAVFSFFLVFYFSQWESLFLILVANMLVMAAVARVMKKKLPLFLSAVSFFLFIVVALLADFKELENRLLFPGQEVIMQKESPFGNLTLTRMYGQWQLYENNQVIHTSGQLAGPEEKVHHALIQHPQPKNILLVFGTWSGMLQEVAKYDPKKVDAVEMNRDISRILAEEIAELSAPWLNMHYTDPRIFLKKARPHSYDAILVNAPPPANLQANRFFTMEFFALCKNALTVNGIFLVPLPSSGNYLGEAARKNHSILYHTLKEVFPFVSIVPGEEDYFIASDLPMNWDITGLLEEKGLDNIYLNPYYFDDELLNQRSRRIHEALLETSRHNTDMQPVATINQWRHWLSHFTLYQSILPLIFVLLIMTSLLRMGPVQVVLFTGGFASASLEVILFLAFQVLFGYLYLVTGMLITTFMLGLFIGSKTAEKESLTGNGSFLRNLFILSAMALLTPAMILLLRSGVLPHFFIPVFIGISTLLVAVLVGGLFARGTRMLQAEVPKASGMLYSADLLGSAMGALLVSAILIPLTGLVNTSLITAGVAATGGVWFLVEQRKRRIEA